MNVFFFLILMARPNVLDYTKSLQNSLYYVSMFYVFILMAAPNVLDYTESLQNSLYFVLCFYKIIIIFHENFIDISFNHSVSVSHFQFENVKRKNSLQMFWQKRR